LENMPEALIKKSIGIDVVILNEVFHKHRDRLLEHLKVVWPHQTKMLSSTFSVESGGVFILSKTPILDEREVVFPDAKSIDYFAAKGVKYIKTIIRNQTVHIFGLHLQATYKSELEGYQRVRSKQIRTLRSFIDKQSIPAAEPVFIGGDFNISFRSQEYQKLTKVLNAVLPKFVGKNPKYSMSNTNQLTGMSDEASDNNCLEDYRISHTCKCCHDDFIDYIFVLKSSKLNIRYTLDVWSSFKPTRQLCGKFNGNLIKKKNDRCPGNLIEVLDLSDHYPVVANISWKRKKPQSGTQER
jgi:endonuclease/exonuclease/phosphatase family metal-dependent hydrolase